MLTSEAVGNPQAFVRHARRLEGNETERRESSVSVSSVPSGTLREFMEDCLERIGEDDPEGKEGGREIASETREEDIRVTAGRPWG